LHEGHEKKILQSSNSQKNNNKNKNKSTKWFDNIGESALNKVLQVEAKNRAPSFG
jgi:hypothetical protein